MIHLKRIHEAASSNDGHRVLIDRVWPRGVAKKDAELEEWCKDLAPTKELRQWFGHDRHRWEQFATSYREELKTADPDTLAHLRALANDSAGLTLLFSARDTECNNAVVLKSVLEEEQ